MNLIKETEVYVFFDPHVSPSFVELLTILKQEERLLFFKEKAPYYAVEYKQFLFYAVSYNVAGSVLIVEKLWHLPLARLIEKGRHLVGFFRKSAATPSYNNMLEKDSLTSC